MNESLKKLSRREQEEVLDLAIDLYSADLSGREADAKALIASAREVGVPEEYLEKAAGELRDRRAAAMVRAQRNRWRALVGIAVAVAVALVVVVGIAIAPGPVQPFAEGFDGGAARWALDVSPQSNASVRFEGRENRGEVAVVSVQRFAPGADGRYHVNLDSVSAPADLSRHGDVSFAARGRGLETVRLYVEGDTVRWRSSPLRVTSDWSTHRLSLRSFEKQERRGDAWSVVAWDAPEDVRRLSFKVGQFMNEPDASGEVEIDDLRIE